MWQDLNFDCEVDDERSLPPSPQVESQFAVLPERPPHVTPDVEYQRRLQQNHFVRFVRLLQSM